MCKETKEQEVVDLIKLYPNYTNLFDKNEVAAHETYIGMLTTITGYIKKVYYEYWDDKGYIIAAIVDISKMSNFDSDVMGERKCVKCRFKQSDLPNIVKLRKGNIATIHGQFKGHHFDSMFRHGILLSDCVVWQSASVSKYSQGEIQW